jgi:hypothetical protein
MPTSNIATAADYADAMMIARRAKSGLFFLLLLMLLVQIGTFFVARMTNYLAPEQTTPSMSITIAPAAIPATMPAMSATTQPAVQGATRMAGPTLQYVTSLIDFFGIVLVIVLAVVLLLITTIMLVGRLIGVAQVTSAFVWCVFLGILLFPHQTFWQDVDFSNGFKIPGVLYTWAELMDSKAGARFVAGADLQSVLHWARFVGWPVVALIVLLMVQAKSSRGLRAALGESELEAAGELAV